MLRIFSKPFFLVLCLVTLISGQSAFSCSRILKAEKNEAVLVARTMDWNKPMPTHWKVYPKGLSRNGLAEPNHSLEWVSKYGSVVTTAYDAITTDGINEPGLAAHILWLDESNYGERNDALPGLSVAMWTQFYLDNFSTVAEAVWFTNSFPFQIIPAYPPTSPEGVNLHLALEDATGDSAIIEYTNGKPTVYHDRAYKVLTNSPTYDQQLQHLNKFNQLSNTSDEKSLPGTTTSMDRFIRANFYLARLPHATTITNEIAGLQSVVHSVSEPFGVSTPERRHISPTIWQVMADLTHRVYYFRASTGLNTVWVSLDKLDFRKGSPIMKLDLLSNPNLAGNVAHNFSPESAN